MALVSQGRNVSRLTTLKSLRQLDELLRSLVNAVLNGADAYSTLRLALVLLGLSRLLSAVRRASRCEGVYSWLLALISPWLKKLPFVRAQLVKETAKIRDQIKPSLVKDVINPQTSLPKAGQTVESLLTLMNERRELDTKYWIDGHQTGAIYHGERSYMDFVGQIYGMFAYTNPLHASIHPATRQMESEVRPKI